MSNQISQDEINSILWKACDTFRGTIDPSEYKIYILVILFVKYISDQYAGRRDALLEVPAGARFSDMVALKGDKEIGDKINKLIQKIVSANEVLQGIAFPDSVAKCLIRNS